MEVPEKPTFWGGSGFFSGQGFWTTVAGIFSYSLIDRVVPEQWNIFPEKFLDRSYESGKRWNESGKKQSGVIGEFKKGFAQGYGEYRKEHTLLRSIGEVRGWASIIGGLAAASFVWTQFSKNQKIIPLQKTSIAPAHNIPIDIKEEAVEPKSLKHQVSDIQHEQRLAEPETTKSL